MAKHASVDDYMATLPEDRRAVMEQLRATVRAAAPDATEVISYNMPALKLNGRFLVSYEAFKHHYSIFPWTNEMVANLGDDVKPYAAGKGTLRFSAAEPISMDLVTRIVEFRVREVTREADAERT
jgi:uncharacterized protein YdhG (YjbR/CyaY superfamily)